MSPPAIRVAPLKAAEVDTLVALARVIWRQHYPAIISPAQIEYMLAQRYAPELVRAQLDQAGMRWLVAHTDQRMVGFAHYFPDAGPERMKLDKLYVHPDARRVGVGAALLARIEAETRAQGCNRLVLRTNRHNAVALAAYRKYGFKIIGEIVTDIGGGFVMDDYALEKILNQYANP